jgi:hypothetical protein
MGNFFAVTVLAILGAALGCSSTTTTQPSPATGGATSTDGGQGAEPGAEGGEGGTSAVAPTAGAGGGSDSLCATYCSQVQDGCTGDFAVYTSDSTCLGVCGALPAGSAGDEIGDTVECRLRQVTNAVETGEPDQHCPKAGPGGDGVCGQNCESYCVLLQSLCTAHFDATFDGLAACTAACADLPDVGGFSTAINQGDSIQCRLWHVSAAAVDPSTHCPHAAGEGPCAAVSP